MSIASELNALNGYILGAYDEINTKGGTVPANKNMANLPTAIESIPAGGSFVGIQREVDANGAYGVPTQSATFSLPTGTTDIKNYALYYAFYYCTALTSVDLSSLTTLTGNYAFCNAFYGCNLLTSVDLSSLTSIDGSNSFSGTFTGCTALTSVDLSSLTRVDGSYAFNSTFSNCTHLTSVDLSSLTTLRGSYAFSRAFSNCTSLESLSFPALTTSSFASLNNQFNNMLSGVIGCTVHFPASIQTKIGSWSSVTSGFGGTSTKVLFDL